MKALARLWPRLVSGAAILAVAAVAGLISYQHIYDLSLALHQSLMVARLMPAGIDGLVTVGSVILMQGGRLGWLGIGPGVAISLFANVESGIRYGVLAAIWAGIPAVSFALACFILENWLKAQARAGAIPARDDTAETVAADTVPGAVPASVPVDAPVDVSTAGIPPVSARRVRTVAPKRASGRTSKSPARVFAAEIEAGTLPSLREVKRRAKCGTPRATEIREHLTAILAQPKAA